jgi:amino acid adenylation domain-containing protein/non-ribosomal peptide synthase protein (TIGR01720 family)
MREQSKKAYRLSAQQRRLWLMQAEGEPDFAQCAVRIEGDLEPEDLRRACQQTVDRYEILRTGFRHQTNRKLPLQVVSATGEPSWISWDDDPAVGAAAQAGDLATLFARHRALPLSLESESLLRLTLLPLSHCEHLLLVTLPTLCADAQSFGSLVDEMARAYAHETRGRPADDPVQYVDFSQWQDELLEEDSDQGRAGRAYWTGLDLSWADLRLPFESRPAPAAPFRPRTHALSLSLARSLAVEETAARCGVSLEVLLLGCWQVLLRRVTGRPDPLIGKLFDGRGHDELKGALGLFASVLPIAAPPGDPPFTRYLELVGEAVTMAAQWQEHGLARADAASPEGAPELPFVFEFDDSRGVLKGRNLTFSIVRREVGLGRFRLKLRCMRTDSGLALEIQDAPDLLPAEEIARWLERLDTLLEAVVIGPERHVGDLEVLGPAEKRQLVEGFSRTARKLSGELVHRRFESQAALAPGKEAVVYEDRSLTYEALNRRANQLAYHLRSLGVGPEERVALFLERSEASIVGLLGVLKAGGAYVPLDPSFPTHRIAAMLEDSEVAVVITQASLIERLPASGPGCICLDQDAAILARYGETNPDGGAAAESLAYVLFTSGSTGRPKGVAVEHRQLCNYLDAVLERMEVPPGLSFATVSTLAADLGNTMIFPSLCTGGSLHVIAQDRASDAVALAQYFTQHAVDCLKIVPSHLSALLKADRAAELLPRQRLILGGEASSWELIEQVQRLAPQCRILNHYGPTETTVGVMTYRVEREHGAAAGLRLPLGRPLANCSIYLLDERQMMVPIGAYGELYVGGESLARGYLGKPDLTAERFVPDPFSAAPGRRLYRTGDLARCLASYDLEFAGRADRQIKLRGFRIEPGEVEAVLVQHPAIWEAVVTVREEGAQEKRLVAYLVPRPGHKPTVEELRPFFRDRLADYMMPAVLMILEALPLTANGKVDLQALPSPEQFRSQTARERVAPRTAAEQSLATIWSEILGVEQVGVHDNFFELGGDSILAIQVIARANQEGLRLNPKQLFEHQTIAALAGVAGTAPEVRAEQGPLQGEVPLTPIQHWFFEQGFADPHHWNQSLLFELAREVPAHVIERAATALLTHHDALRMRFRRTAAGWRQSIADPRQASPVHLRVDLSALPAAVGLTAATAVAAEAQGSLDLEQGPLFRIVSLATGQDRPARILIAIHHLVVDGVSWRVLLDDFTAACEQLCQGGPVALPPKTNSFQQWAERLCEYARSENLQPELDYWLSTIPRQREPLPTDFAGRDTVASERVVITTLGREETQALLQEVPAAYRVQINDVLLTALARGWSRWSSQPSLLLELEGHGREDLFAGVDLSRTVGWFTTHFPVCLDAGLGSDPGRSLGASLRAVKEALRGIPQRGIGYGLLRYLGPPESARPLRELPEPEVTLNYLGQLDRGLGMAASIRPVPGSAGPSHSPRARRPRPLTIEGSIAGGQLRLAWKHSRDLHREATIAELARCVDQELRALIAHCLEAETGGCTPSDFPLARLSQLQLDRLLASLPSPGGAAGIPAHRWVEDLYPASPLQKSLLSHLLATPGTTVGFEQKSSTLRGELDPQAFERVWQAIVDRHPILRTAFAWDGVGEPLQVVSRRAALPLEIQDWRHLPQAERSARLAAFLAADRERGFDLARAPLMRIALLRLTDSVYQLVWSYSHLLLDAWCRTLILREVFSCYKALRNSEEIRLPPPRPYRDYIAWLQRQEPQRAAAFWRRQLDGFSGVTPFRVEWLSEPAPGVEAYVAAAVVLPPATLEALQSFVRRQKLTLNTLIQGGWAVLLARYSGARDVVFGTTVSGRPPALPGVDSILGMFINNLPVRAEAQGQVRTDACLLALQGQLLELRDYEFCSLDQIFEWSGVPRRQRLFDSLVLFQNYPIDDLPQEEDAAGVEVLSYHGRLETSYPLTVVIAPAASLRLEIFYQTGRFDSITIRRMLQHLTTVLESLAHDPARPLAAVSLLTAPEQQQILVEWAEPRAGRRLHVLTRDLEPVPAGVPGELCVAGSPGDGSPGDGSPGTAARWLPDPWSEQPGSLLLRTGDLARFLPNGEIEFLGRLDRVEKIRGEAVPLGVIEAALRRHPAVGEAAVRTWTNEAGDRRLTAYVVVDPTAAPTADELRASVRTKLPRSMVPVLFVFLDAMPLTPAGEVDSAALPPPDDAGSRMQAAFLPPRDNVELMLVQVWEDLFGIHPLGIRDNFFELGGYSLLAIQLLAKIPGHFGRRLTLSTLLQAGTVEEMAKILRQEVDSRPWSPLVELQAGDVGNGRRSLFCVHPLGGEVLCYRDLAVALGADQPLFAFQARGWEDDLEPHDSIEEMAGCYLAAMRQTQPQGPYCLAGWSFGGLVALEMAQQLQAAGEEVGLLVILDTTLTPPPPAKSPRFGKLAQFEQAHPSLSFSEMWELASREEDLAGELEAIKRMFRVPAGLDPRTVQRYQRTGQSLGRAKERYQPLPYAGPIVLCRAVNGHVLHSEDPTFGWSALAAGGLEIIDVPGSHNDMVYRPHVHGLAAKLRDCLDRVRRLELPVVPGAQAGHAGPALGTTHQIRQE